MKVDKLVTYENLSAQHMSCPRFAGWTFQVSSVLAFRLAPLHVFVYILACTTAMLADRGLSQGPIFDLLH
jgi:hypothetical protein